MLFNSYIFIAVFLPLTLAFYYLVRIRVGREVSFLVLCIASLFYYAYWKVTYVPILVVSILGNYVLGFYLSQQVNKNLKKTVLLIGITSNLCALGYYKYANFFLENISFITGVSYSHVNVVLPLAISFFTFQQVAYLIDAYRGLVKEYKFLHYVLFVTFFPQLIAGPIVHHKEMLPQFMQRIKYVFDRELFALGMVQFSIGLFKKVVIADTLSTYATPVFSAADQGANVAFGDAWLGVLAYTFQLYFDFSGYSDMALGLSKMFGINLPINFNSPYKAFSISDFWRRWHMTLSRFLRDYVYISLGGNRKGKARRHVNLFLTMLLGGLWHGASWNFVLWGGLHGMYLVINHAWSRITKSIHVINRDCFLYKAFALLLTFLCVVAAWILFRAESFSGAMQIYRSVLNPDSFSLSQFLNGNPDVIANPIVAIAFTTVSAAIAFFCPNAQELLEKTKQPKIEVAYFKFSNRQYQIGLAALSALLFVAAFASINRVSEFLYFQF